MNSSTAGMDKTSSALKRQRLESLSLVENLEGRKRNHRQDASRISNEIEEMPERKKQTIIGKINANISKHYNVLLIADKWPTFSVDYFLPSNRNHLWIHSPLCPKFFARLLPKFCKWISRSEVMKIVDSGDCSWLVLQGDASFLEDILSTYLHPFLTKVNVLCLLPATRLRKYKVLNNTISKWKRVKHADIGGVTTSQWLIGVNIPGTTKEIPNLQSLIPSFGLHRRVLDIIKPTEKGEIIGLESSLPHVESHVHKRGITSYKYKLPSVFSHTGWVSRSLTLKELGSVIDLPELFVIRLIESMEKNENENTSSCTSLFEGNAPPLKIVQVGRTFLDYLESPKMDTNLLEVPSTVKEADLNYSGILDFHKDEGKGINSEISIDAASRYLSLYGQKAAKDDDAPVPVELWNGYLFEKYYRNIVYDPQVQGRALETLRNKFALRIYWANISRSFRKYLSFTYGSDWYSFYTRHKSSLNTKKRKREGSGLTQFQTNSLLELQKDLKVGLDGIQRVLKGSWWEWDHGSTLFFWRWPKAIRKAARDGVPVFVEGRLPRYRRKQRLPSASYMQEKMIGKLSKVTARGYVEDGKVLSLINCFAVPKGEEDIRLVYDGTKSGLNAAVWAPNFFMPTPDSVLMWVDSKTWFADLDLGEMFLNYFMDERLREYSGVDLSGLLEKIGTDWRRWGRTFMGFSPSPYNAVKLFGWTIDLIYGDRWNVRNPYRWNGLLVNLPGSLEYDPSKPRLCKTWNEIIAAMLEAYVDDVRVLGADESTCREATRRASQILQYLGQQDACRKYRPPHTSPGPWCGSFVAAKDDSVWVYVSDEKWKKAKIFIFELAELVESEAQIPFKFLERGRGFMVYFCRTYPSFTPFLKGLHLTMDSWREGRNQKGWKIKSVAWDEDEEFNRAEFLDVEETDGLKEPPDPLRLRDSQNKAGSKNSSMYDNHPELLIAVPRLAKDLKALKIFLSATKVPWRFVHGNKIGIALYGFGDASKAGFGASLEELDGNIWFRLGVWGSVLENESSNFRELINLVEAIEARVSEGSGLRGAEIFLFTDNSTAEAAFYKGTSSSEKLFEAILRLRVLEVNEGIIIHFIHVAGTRMITQGTDGLSRGDLGEGIMKGGNMLSYIPLHLNALERAPCMKGWISSWLTPNEEGEAITFLDYEGWFEKGHDIAGGKLNLDGVWTPNYKRGTYVWTPPPAAGLIAVEQLRRARVKREVSTHVVLIPRLMSAEWRKQLFKVSDLFVELPFDEFWQKEIQHEPLIFAVVFPFLSHRPWQLKRSPAFLGMGNVLRSMWKEDNVTARTVLRKLFTQQRRLGGMQEGLVRKMLQSPGHFGFLCPQGGK